MNSYGFRNIYTKEDKDIIVKQFLSAKKIKPNLSIEEYCSFKKFSSRSLIRWIQEREIKI